MEKMLHADVLVFATPIYCYEMSGQMKTIVAYNYGAKKPKRIYQSCRWAMLYSVIFYSIFFLIMEVFPEWVLLLFDASAEMLSIGVTALRILAVSHLLSNVCLIYSAAFQGLGLGVQSMLLTLGRQVVLPVVFIAAFSHFGNLTLIWLAFVLAEAVVIPIGIILWRRESDKVLKNLKWEENRRRSMSGILIIDIRKEQQDGKENAERCKLKNFR